MTTSSQHGVPALFTAPVLEVHRGPDLVVRTLGGFEDQHHAYDEDGIKLATVDGVHTGNPLRRMVRAVVGFVFPVLQRAREWEVTDPQGDPVLLLRTWSAAGDVRYPDQSFVGSFSTARVGPNRMQVLAVPGKSRLRWRRPAARVTMVGPGPDPSFAHDVLDAHGARIAHLSDDGRRRVRLELEPGIDETLRGLTVGLALCAVDTRWLHVPRAVENG